MKIFLIVLFCFSIAWTQDRPIHIWIDPSANGEGDGSQATPFKTIEKAFEQQEDTEREYIFHLQPGNYVGNVYTTPLRSITLRAVEPLTAVLEDITIRGDVSVTFEGVETLSVVLVGVERNIINFRVSNCFIHGTTFNSIKIENFVLENSRIEDLQIFCQNIFNIRIRNCHFNQSNFLIEDTSDVEVTDSIFEGNSRTPLYAHVREIVTLDNCTFRDNSPNGESNTGAILIRRNLSTPNVFVHRSTFIGNSIAPVIHLANAIHVEITSSTFISNLFSQTDLPPGLVSITASSVVVENVTFTNNTGTNLLFQASNVTLTDVTIEGSGTGILWDCQDTFTNVTRLSVVGNDVHFGCQNPTTCHFPTEPTPLCDTSCNWDRCGACNGSLACLGCDGIPWSGNELNECGKCLETCPTDSLPPPTDSSPFPTDNSSFPMVPVVAGVVSAAIVLFLVSGILCFLLFRRKQNPKNDYTFTKSYDQLNVTIIKLLGEGNFGQVFLGDCGGTPCACKLPKDPRELEQEARMLSTLTHPNIVQFMGLYTSPDNDTYMVFEYVSGGSLNSYLPAKRNQLQTSQLLAIALGTARGMAYLEYKGIVHRDLSARNILIEQERILPKVSDFGMSRDQFYSQTDGVLPIRWSAPEVLNQQPATCKSDTFSFGIVLWEIFSFGSLPFADKSNNEASEMIRDPSISEKLSQPSNCPDTIYKLMLRCWKQDPTDRPSFVDIVDILNNEVDDGEIADVTQFQSKSDVPYYQFTPETL